MPSARPNSGVIPSGSTGVRSKTATATSSEDPLATFSPEMPPPLIVVPTSTPATGPLIVHGPSFLEGPSIVERVNAGQRAKVDVQANHVSRRALEFERFTLSESLRTTLISFGGGVAAGVLAMWLAVAQAPPAVVPSSVEFSTPQTLTSRTISPLFDLPPMPSDAQPAPQVTRAATTSRPSPVATATIGTSGRRTGRPSQAARPARAASAAPPAIRRNPAAASTTPTSRYKGSLALRSAPQGAKVFVNGTFVGSTPLLLENLPVGSRAVRMEADGYQRWSTSTRVVADQQTGVSATLAPARQ